MAVPNSRQQEAFVYRWTDSLTGMLYLGVHKGTVDDGYICSSKYMLKEYKKRPTDFTREIVSQGLTEDMHALEVQMLVEVDAARNPKYYNKHNGGNNFLCLGHTEDTRRKMSETWKSRTEFNCNNVKAIANWRGKHHSEDAKNKMKEAAKNHTAKRSAAMTTNNPMKDPAAIQRMLETRRINKELRNGRA